jgi:hypothetical protein
MCVREAEKDGRKDHATDYHKCHCPQLLALYHTLEAGAYNIVKKSSAYPPYTTTLSIVEFLRLAWREEPPPARGVTVTGLDTLLASVPQDKQTHVARFIREILQDVANQLANRQQTVQLIIRGTIDRGQYSEVRQPSGEYVNLSSIFGDRPRQEANDWLVAPLWI